MAITHDEYIDYLDLNCKGDKCCSDPACQKWVTDYHRIDGTTMDAMVLAFFDSMPPFYTLAAAALSLANAPCGDLVLCNYDPNTQDNGDIAITIGPATATATTSFSAALFKGVQDLFAPSTYAFSKAKDDEGNVTLVFKGLTGAAGSIVYCGDRSQTNP